MTEITMRRFNLVWRLMLVSAAALSCASCGPRMRNQPSIQPFEQKMPDMPAGTTPVAGRLRTYTLQQSQLTENPLPLTATTLRNGRVYYGYYCLMCHGEDGEGNGPVGQGFVPKPTDLTSSAVASLTDGQFYLRMLTGAGHDPVMDQTVLPGHRWPLVMYVRTFGETERLRR